MKIPSPPIPQEGETVYSLFARICRLTGMKPFHISEAITGIKRLSFLFGALPGWLKAISMTMQYGHPWTDVEYIIRQNTNLGYFTYFDLETERIEIEKKYGLETFAWSICLQIGVTINRWPVAPRHPKYCPICADEQKHNNGFAYFRREHHLPCVSVCWKHNHRLVYGCEKCGAYPLRFNPICMPGECNCEKIDPLYVPSLPLSNLSQLWIAQESQFILNSSRTNHKCNIRAIINDMYKNHGFSRGRLLHRPKITDRVLERFGLEIFEFLGYDANRNRKNMGWLNRVFNLNLQIHRCPPALILFLIGAISENVASFESEYALIEDSKKSINCATNIKTASSAMQSEFINSASVVEKFRRGRGWLKCIATHFGVSCQIIAKELLRKRYRLELNERVIRRIGRSKVNAIKNSLRIGTPKMEILKDYNISDWTLTLIELDDPDIAAMWRVSSKNKKLINHRENFLRFLKNAPKAKRSEVRKAIAGTFEHLYHNDREWLDSRLPRIPKKSPRKIITIYTDYDAIDREKSELLDLLIRRSKIGNEKPVRITKHYCLTHIGIVGKYYLHSEKYPLISSVIDQHVESYKDFVRRRICWALEALKQEGWELSMNKLRRKCGLAEHYLKENRNFIVEQAERLGIQSHERAYF